MKKKLIDIKMTLVDTKKREKSFIGSASRVNPVKIYFSLFSGFTVKLEC
jgi:hypothetical protein